MRNKNILIRQSAAAFVANAFQKMGAAVNTQGNGSATTCYFICNTDQSVRWIWPAHAKAPEFLRFYHGGSWRSKLYTAAVKLAFGIGLGKMMASGSTTVFETASSATNGLSIGQAWALFTGTSGPNRKMVLWHRGADSISAFVKIVYGKFSPAILKKEASTLRILAQMPMNNIAIPEVLFNDEHCLALSDVAQKTSPAGTQLSSLPFQACQQWMFESWQPKLLQKTNFYHQLQASVASLDTINDHRIPAGIIQNIKALFEGINTQAAVPFAVAHGDFTPWNMRVAADSMALIDWELSLDEAPLLFDAFHFVYQSNILIGNKGYSHISKSLKELFAAPKWNTQVQSLQLDTAQLEQLYLLHNVCYYLHVYHHQQQWHTQVQWLLQTWNDALSYWLASKDALQNRQQLLSDVGVFLHAKPHAALKFRDQHITQLSTESDLDICMPYQVAMQLQAYLKSHPAVASVKTDKKTYMIQMAIFLKDGSLLHIDAIWQFKRKAVDFLNVSKMLHTAVDKGAGIKQATYMYDFMYTWLFYLLNDAEMPMHYKQKLENSKTPEQQAILNYINEHTGMQVNKIAELLQSEAPLKAAVQRWMNGRLSNRGAEKRANQIKYAIDTMSSWFKFRGCVITFSGVDGAGKSTVIDAMRHQVEKVLRRKVVVLRHRPSVLPILSAWKYGKKGAEQKAAQTLPRQGSNKSTLGSVMRFAYYYSDYLLGQFYIHLKYVMRGYVVLYDRYYFDFINDSKRSNIQLPKKVTAFGYRLLLKPKLNFFLYATPEEILVRKQELDAETIETLTRQYMELFQQLTARYRSSSYQPIHNQSLPNTLAHIFQQIKASA